jgi:hypothetical protein
MSPGKSGEYGFSDAVNSAVNGIFELIGGRVTEALELIHP